MKTTFTICTRLRFVSVLFGVMLLAACTTPESSPAPSNPNDPDNQSISQNDENDESEEEQHRQTNEENDESELSFSVGNDTKILSAEVIQAPFDAMYTVPHDMDISTSDQAITFTGTSTLPYDLQVTVGTEPLPSDIDLAKQRDYTSLSLRSNENEPNDIDLELFPELPFDYYYSIETDNETIHRLGLFDEETDEMYRATLNTPEFAATDPDSYRAVVSLFHAIVSSANDVDEDLVVDERVASMPLLDKLQDRSAHDVQEETVDEHSSVMSIHFKEEEHSFLVESHTLFDSITISLPQGYEKRALGENSYSFTNREDDEFSAITLIVGLTHPDIPLDLHVNALRSSNEELRTEEYPMLDFFDYVFVEETNETDTFQSATLIKEREDDRIFEASIRTTDSSLDDLAFTKLMTSLLDVTDNEEEPVK
ncbi:hypothetical protein [Bacillus sp. Marseille-P3800]|uniref:hypothetical protein n=1 Tax=Bacillus sp. Marseille-P3800 TaxID=2014782 RepID=UPI000C07D5E1|nr:hypothetical protein [Bacillus sp. Marseille-P3800]